MNAHRPTCRLFNKQCRTAIIISRTVILMNRWQSATGCGRIIQHNANNIMPTTRGSIPCHNGRIRQWLVLFVHCLLNILPVQAYDDDRSSGMGEFCGQPAKTGHVQGWHRFYAGTVSGQQRCADREILIHIILRSLTKDPCLQSITICNLESSLQLVRVC